MSETDRKTPTIAAPNVEDTLFDKRDRLLAERGNLRATTAKLAQRDREIDRELADVQAAGRVFGIEVPLPKDDGDHGQKDLWTTSAAMLKQYFRTAEARPTILGGAGLDEPPKTAGAKAVATKAEMPRVSDIVLDRLKKAGKKGSKAAPIQNYIETTYSTKIHDKTVGMTLYRLQQHGLVRRRGHTWFIAQEVVNPGAATPGPVTEKH